MDRLIEVKVGGNYLSKDNKNAGVQHEGNVTFLRIRFDEGWDGYAKKVTWWDAQGLNPVERTLTTNLLEDITKSTRVYLVPIPAEPLAVAGWCTFVIDGYSDGKRQRSVSDQLLVKEAPFIEVADEPVDPTPSQAEQLQEEIDEIIDTIQDSFIARDEAVAAADAAKESEENAKASEDHAASSEANAKASEEAAAASEANAKASEEAAAASEEAAASSASEAAASEENAAQSANAAARSEEHAAESERSAASSAETATTAATEAGDSAQQAEWSAAAAKDSEQKADNSAKLAKSWAVGGTGIRAGEEVNNAKYWSDRAQGIAGGDFATHAELQAVQDMIVKIQVGGDEPVTGPTLWYDTDIELPAHNMNLDVASPGESYPVSLCVDDLVFPIKNATLNSEPTAKTYDFTVK